jgi:hypothetical protein
VKVFQTWESICKLGGNIKKAEKEVLKSENVFKTETVFKNRESVENWARFQKDEKVFRN